MVRDHLEAQAIIVGARERLVHCWPLERCAFLRNAIQIGFLFRNANVAALKEMTDLLAIGTGISRIIVLLIGTNILLYARRVNQNLDCLTQSRCLDRRRWRGLVSYGFVPRFTSDSVDIWRPLFFLNAQPDCLAAAADLLCGTTCTLNSLI